MANVGAEALGAKQEKTFDAEFLELGLVPFQDLYNICAVHRAPQ